MADQEFIPFSVDTSKIIKIISDQIYQSPMALLRENTQNAYDAILMRLALNEPNYRPQIDILVEAGRVSISDNGIGMSREVVEKNFWKAGSSGKNNDEARKAGVVGTFGIGALANFGIADSLTVVTESLQTSERTKTFAKEADLDINTDCIKIETLEATGNFGTTVEAIVSKHNLNISQAKSYLDQFVSTLDFPVYYNGQLISQNSLDTRVPPISYSWETEEKAYSLDSRFSCDILMQVSSNAQVRVGLTNIIYNRQSLKGRVLLLSSGGSIQTFRSGFGLSAAAVSSHFAFGGVIDLQNLKPTAGREALNTESLQFLQSLMPPLEKFVCENLAKRAECDNSNSFMNWVKANRRYELCGELLMNIEPGKTIKLEEIKKRSSTKLMNTYSGRDTTIMKTFSSDENPLLVLSPNNPRRTVQTNYLAQFCKTSPIPDSPQILSHKTEDELSIDERALAFRLETILDSDYFLNAGVKFGKISHGVDILTEHVAGKTTITLDPDVGAIKVLLNLYNDEFSAFTSLVKDFIRNTLFHKIAAYVPSSTRQGAEAFLKAIQKNREVFEIEEDDTDEISAIWEEYKSGKITMGQATQRASNAPRKTTQTVDRSTAAKVADVIPDVARNEAALEQTQEAIEAVINVASPPISRLDTSTSAKMLTIDSSEEAIRGYRSFISLTDKARNEYGDFFLQPHKTSCVWGGQKILFIFTHHSDRYGLYYDIQTQKPVDAEAGGGSFVTSTLVLKNKTFIPIPTIIASSFLPKQSEKKRFDIRYDIIRSDFA